MPAVSQNQNAAMHAAAEGHSTLGIPKSVGQDFVNATHGMSVKSLPKKKADPPHKKHVQAYDKAMASGDHAMAMHHAGHMLRIAKAGGASAPEPDQDEQGGPPDQDQDDQAQMMGAGPPVTAQHYFGQVAPKPRPAIRPSAQPNKKPPFSQGFNKARFAVAKAKGGY